MAEAAPETAAPPVAGFPPYAPYETTPAPPSVAHTISAGHILRRQHKSVARKPAKPPPRPARAGYIKATDVKLPRQAMRAQAKCLKRHGAVLTDRLDRMAKPPRRAVLSLWRDYAETLPPETIARLRTMLDADEPFKPDQAYQYFVNLRRTKKKQVAADRVSSIKRDILAMCTDKRFMWARNATVVLARGIQQRLSIPTRFALADGMLRLSNIILKEMCGHMRMRMPSRRNTAPKAKFMMEMADKIAVWIDEILSESDDRMLMMDFDEDDDVTNGDRFADDFLDMMGDGRGGDGGGRVARDLLAPNPAWMNFKGPMLEAFMVLTAAMNKKGTAQLLQHGKFTQTYSEGAEELKRALDVVPTDYNSTLAGQLLKDLDECSKPDTPENLAKYMKDMIEICSKYLSQVAEHNKDKGPAFRLLVHKMRTKGGEELFQKQKVKRTYKQAATNLEKAKGLESDHDDPAVTEKINSQLTKLMEGATPPELKTEMTETIDLCSKYLSQEAVDEIERGPAFDLLIKELERDGAEHFSEFHAIPTRFKAAYILKSAPWLSGIVPDPPNVPVFSKALHLAVDAATKDKLKSEMNEVIERCANYLSAFVRDRDIAMANLLKMMKSKPSNIFAARPNYKMDYATGAMETETAPSLVPYLAVKDIADEGKAALMKDMQGLVPDNLVMANKALVQDVARHLSQAFALRSGAAGERYPLEFLSAVKKSLGKRELFKYKSFGQTYSDAANTLLHSGPLEVAYKSPNADTLKVQIKSEMSRGVPEQIPLSVAKDLHTTMDQASAHLAKVGITKGNTLEHLMKMMKDKGQEHLAVMQGYDQTYTDAADRVEGASSLANDTVEKKTYTEVKDKFTAMAEEKKSAVPEEHQELIPELIEETSKFLAKPTPQTQSEKRQVLADLMTKQGDKIVGQDGMYKMSHVEGAGEVKKGPVGKTTAHDNAKKDKMVDTVNAVVPKKIEDMLKVTVQEGAAHLVDTIKGRGEAMKVIHDNIDKEKQKEFLSVGNFKKTHEEAAGMLKDAKNFDTGKPSPAILDIVSKKVNDAVGSPAPSGHMTEEHIQDAKDITSKYIAGKAIAECGLDPNDLAALEASGKLGQALAGMAGGVGGAGGGRGGLAGPETEAERRRLEADSAAAAARARGMLETAARNSALRILHEKLNELGNEVLYEQPNLSLTHQQASNWLKSPPEKTEKSVKESGDTARLSKKFEKKLDTLVSPVTPPLMHDAMQDVVIESARQLSEQFVSLSYADQSRSVIIAEMQRRENEILTEIDGAAETTFFAAQRLKRPKNFSTKDLCTEEAPRLQKRLDEIMRYSTMPRKLAPTVKELNKDAAYYLSTLVTKPDSETEAYVAMLEAMEQNGDAVLVDGKISKTNKEAAAYLRQLTSLEDKLSRANSTLQSDIEAKLRAITADVHSPGLTSSTMNNVITQNTKYLVSNVMFQGEKTEALNVLVEKMDGEGNNILLRHGTVRKSHKEGADILRGLTADKLAVTNADPVVSRKVEIKLLNLMQDNTPKQFVDVMKDVIKDAKAYLAVHLLEPQIIRVCKCMKSVFVQCELWCEEILRRVAKPPCTCSRHVSAQDIEELSALNRLRVCPESVRILAPGLEVAVTECLSKHARKECQALKPTPECRENVTDAYPVHSVNRSSIYEGDTDYPTRLPPESPESREYVPSVQDSESESEYSSTVKSLLLEIHSQNVQYMRKHEQGLCFPATRSSSPRAKSDCYVGSSPTLQSPMCSKIFTRDDLSRSSLSSLEALSSKTNNSLAKDADSPCSSVSSERMADWHAMMVSLIWNVQAWRKWIQENIDRGLTYKYDPLSRPEEPENSSWTTFQRRVSTEALQWRQYNIFSRQLILRLISRYQDKEVKIDKISKSTLLYETVSRQITSPGRHTTRTERYCECAAEMLDIISMFNNWTQFLILVIRESSSLHDSPTFSIPLHVTHWSHYKNEMSIYSQDWIWYNLHLKECWEKKYESFLSECVPYIYESRPVWVVGACGVVPSGAVAAGICDGEVIWIARTTHRSSVLPAALHPSKHCCSVYTGGAVHHYTKYQVMCNAEVNWIAWRGGQVGVRAIRVAEGVYIGRVHYRGSHIIGPVHAPQYHCHVVIFGRAFAFNCYDLLILADSSTP